MNASAGCQSQSFTTFCHGAGSHLLAFMSQAVMQEVLSKSSVWTNAFITLGIHLILTLEIH